MSFGSSTFAGAGSAIGGGAVGDGSTTTFSGRCVVHAARSGSKKA
jgi:hypothetical protein